MEAIGRELEAFVPKGFVKNVSDKATEISSTANATAESMKFLQNLNLFEPINNDLLVANLGKYIKFCSSCWVRTYFW